MIIVTGTKRSGTSMWMQILAAAGLEVIGERFPRHWGEHLSAANPDGFYESELIAGIYFRTNPHPLTGVFLFPDQTIHHAVKVFIPGLIRSDLAFLDRVIASVRSWRAFARSRERLRTLVRASAGEAAGETAEEGRSLPPGLEWWSENFALVRDIATRRYAAHVLSYDSLLADPERVIHEVVQWLGVGDAKRACAVVHRDKPRDGSGAGEQSDGEVDSTGLEPRHIAVFDELYESIDRGRPLTQALIDRLNLTDRELRPLLIEHNAAVKTAALAALADGGG
jgi:hypothetical protein